MAPRRSRAQLGIEPEGIDLLPILSRPLTLEEAEQLATLSAQQRAENDANPQVVALRKQVALDPTLAKWGARQDTSR